MTQFGQSRDSWSSVLRKWALMLVLMAGTGGVGNAATTVKFATPPWPGAQIKTRVASDILNAIGYRTSASNAAYDMLGAMGYNENSATGSWAVNISSVGNGFKNVNLAVWMPMQKGLVDPLTQSGKIKLVATNIPNAQYDLVVPDYVWRAGVHCICDLYKHGSRFKHKIYGIEAGNHGNQIVKRAIQYDTYHLQNWQLVESNVTSMLKKAQKLIKQHKWIVFLGWKPHWMNEKMNIHYLRDPRNLWHMNKTKVFTAVNSVFMHDNPNVVRFLKQFVVGSKIQSRWIYEYAYKGISADKVANQWIANHTDKISQWLEGVKTADGNQSAISAVESKF